MQFHLDRLHTYHKALFIAHKALSVWTYTVQHPLVLDVSCVLF